MVKIYFHNTQIEIPVANLREKNAEEWINTFFEVKPEKSVVHNRTDYKFKLTYCNELLTSENIGEIEDDDCVRIIAERIPHRRLTSEESLIVHRELDKLDLRTRSGEELMWYLNLHMQAPDFAKKLVEDAQYLKHINPEVFSVLRDPALLASYCAKQPFTPEMQEFHRLHPELMTAVQTIVYDMKKDMAKMQKPRLRAPPQQNRPSSSSNNQDGAAITQADLQSALAMAFNMPGVAAPQQAGGSAPVVEAPAPQAQQPQQNQFPYQEQLEELRSFGFENDELSMIALEQYGGDIAAATEFLMDINSS